MPDISYDLHIHSCLSPCADDDMTPGNIVGMASLIGLKLIALTDHNSCKNCPAFLKAAEHFGITAVPGMELTTSEEVHVLCYFPGLEEAMAFDAFVEQRMLPFENQPKLFGNQLLCSEEDQIKGIYGTLLISAVSISFFDLSRELERYHGVMVPAHADKQSNSLIGNLGFVPPDSSFFGCEFQSREHIEAFLTAYPYLKKCLLLCSSDAHRLSSLHEADYFLNTDDALSAYFLKMLHLDGNAFS